jgi:hypothetical protein
MPQAAVSLNFDLNIERILEGWETCHAVREVVANALDEQALTGTKEIRIAKDSAGAWHVRDHGRGLKYEHLTQNENAEKLRNAQKVIGKFGVGLKDALGVLHRRSIDVAMRSRHGDITLNRAPKHGFADVVTLQAVVSPPADPRLVGTDVILRGVSEAEIEDAKAFFLRFSGEEILDETQYGQILRRTSNQHARIYANGLRVAEEEGFAFSYYITSLTAAMRKALNRERTNVGRAAYSERVKAMLLASTSDAVAATLADNLTQIEQGTNCDEVNWTDVALHACRVLNAAKKAVFVTASERTAAPDSIDHAIADGHQVVTVPQTIRDRLRDLKDLEGKPVRDLEVYREEWARSFKFKFIPRKELTAAERLVFDFWPKIVGLAGGLRRVVKEIKISEIMRPDLRSTLEPDGLWEPGHKRIIIKRSQLRSINAFAGTLLHELVHAQTGSEDVTREFEQALTALLGKVSTRAIEARIIKV